MAETERLYHCVNREPVGDALEPTCEREVNGRTDKFLFATSYISKAMAFSFDYHDDGEIICNGSIDGTRDEFAIICDRANTLSRPRHIQLFAFSGEGFESLSEGARQSVSTKRMPFAEAECLFISNDVEDTMRYGLQIFATDKTLDQLLDEGFLENWRGDGKFTQIDWLHHLVRNEGFHWENQERNLNPNQKLLDSFSNLTRQQGTVPSLTGPAPL
jgi:hypothetical protein